MIRKPYGKVKSESLAKKQRRKLVIRKKITGTPERPRVCAVRSNKHLSVQVIDDVNGKTILSAQTFGKNAVKGGSNTKEGAKAVGADLGAKLKSANFEKVVFDRNGSKFAGVLSSLAEGMREAGIHV